MRYLLIATLFILMGMNSQAQLKSFIIGAKGDTLNKVDKKGLKQGPWVTHVEPLRGEDGYEEEGFYKDDKKEGAWRRFTLEGDLIAFENYAYGMKNGKCMYFTHAGEPLREESWRAFDPKSPYDTIDVRDVNDPSKIVEKVIVKVEPIAYKNGTWRYYNTMTGAIETTEEWIMNRPKAEVEAEASGDLVPIDVTGGKSTVKKDDKKPLPKPQAILDYEKKNSGKKKIKVRDGSTGG